ncbi:MAG TPA: hypothetical protein VFI33_03400, partial [Puia sp.]|nr:hypothetical protein [Puia sp.]
NPHTRLIERLLRIYCKIKYSPKQLHNNKKKQPSHAVSFYYYAFNGYPLPDDNYSRMIVPVSTKKWTRHVQI